MINDKCVCVYTIYRYMWLKNVAANVQNGPIIATRRAAYSPAEMAMAPGMVHTHEGTMFLNTFRSTVSRPPLKFFFSIQPRAIPAPTTALTWQWVVEVGIPRKVHPITKHEETHANTEPAPGH